jgi:hypothetical protein
MDFDSFDTFHPNSTVWREKVIGRGRGHGVFAVSHAGVDEVGEVQH